MIRRLVAWTLILVVLSACSAVFNQANPIPAETAVSVEPSLSEAPATEAVPTETATSEPPTQEPTATVEITQEPIIYGPREFPQDVSPLTGKVVQDITLLERRPVAVKVQIFPRGQRPPLGVSLADVVYDYYQTFGLTRLHAIFYSQNAETVGPVRSARLLDQSLVSMYQSVFAFGSAEERTYRRLIGSDFANRLVVEGYANCPPLCRNDPNGRNELVANTSDVTRYYSEKGVDNIRQDLTGMFFDPITPADGKPGKQAFVRFSISAYNLWDYNPETGRYLRYQDTQEAQDISLEAVEALIDGLTNTQIAADNVVFLLAPHQYAFGTSPGVNEVIDIGLSGSGPAYAFRDGQVYEAVWNRPGKNSVIFLTYPNGAYYPFKPGSTWFEVVGTSTKVENPSPEAWRFTHRMP